MTMRLSITANTHSHRVSLEGMDHLAFDDLVEVEAALPPARDQQVADET